MNGKQRFIEAICEIAKCKTEQAERVADYYRKEKIVSISKNTGQWTVTHGEMLDKGVLKTAIQITSK